MDRWLVLPHICPVDTELMELMPRWYLENSQHLLHTKSLERDLRKPNSSLWP